MQNDIYQTLSELGFSSYNSHILADVSGPRNEASIFFDGSVKEFINFYNKYVDKFGSVCYYIRRSENANDYKQFLLSQIATLRP